MHKTFRNLTLAAALGGLGLALFGAIPSLAQDAAAAAAAAPAPVPDKGDTSWMLVSTAFVILMARRTSVKLFFTKVDIWLIVAEIVIILLFFYGHYTSTAPQRNAIMPFFSFSSEYFLYGVSIILITVLFPLALVMKLLEVKEEHGEELSPAAVFKMKLSAYMVLAGGFIIRLAFVYAGQLSKLA